MTLSFSQFFSTGNNIRQSLDLAHSIVYTTEISTFTMKMGYYPNNSIFPCAALEKTCAEWADLPLDLKDFEDYYGQAMNHLRLS